MAILSWQLVNMGNQVSNRLLVVICGWCLRFVYVGDSVHGYFQLEIRYDRNFGDNVYALGYDVFCDAKVGIRQKGRVQKELEETWTWGIPSSFQLHTGDME